MGETELSHEIFKKILTYAFRGCWGWMTIDAEIWGCNLKILQLFLKGWLQTSKREGMTNGSKSSDLFDFAMYTSYFTVLL